MSRSAYLILNPVAGRRNPSARELERDLELIQASLGQDIELQVHLTTPEQDADQLARKAIAEGAEAVIAAGGDGTVSAAARALIKTDIPLGILSQGTANAFANALGIPNRIEDACRVIRQGKTRKVDTALCNGKPLILLVGVGLEAEVIDQADRELKNRFGMFAYILAGINQLRRLNKFEATIETEEGTQTLTTTSITIANAAPPTSILAQGPAGIEADDGLLDVTMVAPETRVGAIAASYELIRSALSHEPAQQEGISYIRAKRIRVTTDPPQKVALDGETEGETPIEVECISGGLTIFVPESD